MLPADTKGTAASTGTELVAAAFEAWWASSAAFVSEAGEREGDDVNGLLAAAQVETSSAADVGRGVPATGEASVGGPEALSAALLVAAASEVVAPAAKLFAGSAAGRCADVDNVLKERMCSNSSFAIRAGSGR